VGSWILLFLRHYLLSFAPFVCVAYFVARAFVLSSPTSGFFFFECWISGPLSDDTSVSYRLLGMLKCLFTFCFTEILVVFRDWFECDRAPISFLKLPTFPFFFPLSRTFPVVLPGPPRQTFFLIQSECKVLRPFSWWSTEFRLFLSPAPSKASGLIPGFWAHTVSLTGRRRPTS